MADYMSVRWYKRSTGIYWLAQEYGLSGADTGLHDGLMCVAKSQLRDGFVTFPLLRNVASTLKNRQWKASIERLQEAGLLTILEDGVQLDWTGQETAESIARKSATRPDGKMDIKRLHEAGDHSRCRLRGLPGDCEHATKWAKGYPREDGGNHDHPRGRSESESDQTQSIKSDVDGMTDGTTSSRPGSRPRRSPSVVVSGEEKLPGGGGRLRI